MNWMWWLQIGADALLLLIVAVLIFRLRGLGKLNQISNEEDWENFIRDAGEISREFDRLLNEKRELVKRTLRGLDQRIDELKALQGGFEDLDSSGAMPIDKALDSLPPEMELTPPPPPKPPKPARPAGTPEAEIVERPRETRTKSAAKLSPQAMDSFRSRVLELANEGQRAAQIAKTTGRPQGEVELIMRLNDKEV